jgi:hypothetical protein
MKSYLIADSNQVLKPVLNKSCSQFPKKKKKREDERNGTDQENTSPLPMYELPKQSALMDAVAANAGKGTPNLVVHRKNAGACRATERP